MRLLICRPMGGLNDLLCQIGKCAYYAQRFKRRIVVDTNYEGSDHLRDDIFNYFNAKGTLFEPDISMLAKVDPAASCVPSFLEGRFLTYRLTYDSTFTPLDDVTLRPITFDFERDYSEDILIHHAFGGGFDSIEACKHLTINSILAAELKNRLNRISSDYSAIHVRSTDYKTDYAEYFEKIKNLLGRNVFIASDNIEVVKFFRRNLEGRCVFNFSQLPPNGGRPLHIEDVPQAERYKRNEDAILDLLMLALARRLFAFKISGNPWFSGYSTLAANLRENSSILQGLVGPDFAVHPCFWPSWTTSYRRKRMLAQGILRS